MKLHNTTVENLIKAFTTHGGHREENRLKKVLSNMQFEVYTQQTGNQVLVLSEDIKRALNTRK